MNIRPELMRKLQVLDYKWLIMVPGDEPSENVYLIEYLRESFINRRIDFMSILKSGNYSSFQRLRRFATMLGG